MAQLLMRRHQIAVLFFGLLGQRDGFGLGTEQGGAERAVVLIGASDEVSSDEQEHRKPAQVDRQQQGAGRFGGRRPLRQELTLFGNEAIEIGRDPGHDGRAFGATAKRVEPGAIRCRAQTDQFGGEINPPVDQRGRLGKQVPRGGTVRRASLQIGQSRGNLGPDVVELGVELLRAGEPEAA